MTSPHRYRVFGLRVESSLRLPELVPAAAGDAADVHIRLGSVVVPEGAPHGLSVDDGGALLRIPDVADYRLLGETEIVVDPAPGVAMRNVRIFLLGSALGALAHRRGLLPLHANAVRLGARAVAFAGASGAGKSTLADWFVRRGHPLLTDDVCVVSFVGGRALAHPGVARLRLWRSAIEHRGGDAGQYKRSFLGAARSEKYDVPLNPARLASGSAPLARIYLLDKAADGMPSIEPLAGAAAVEALVANTYRGQYVPTVGDVARHWRSCVALAGGSEVFVARRRWDLNAFDADAALLEAHALGSGQ